jgi:molybdate transport system permease protein
MSVEWSVIITTVQLAATTTLVLAIAGLPLAWWLARSESLAARLAQPLISLPLVLPPTVIGFYLLIAFAPQSALGQSWQFLFDASLAFSFAGLVIGSTLYSLPFFVQPMVVAFRQIPQSLIDASRVLGAGTLDRFFTVSIPLARHGFLIACVMTFAHTVGEFGIVLMIGGNIPEETRVVSVALFDYVEALDYARAHALAASLIGFAFTALMTVEWLNHRAGQSKMGGHQ